MKLRDYQREALDCTLAKFEDVDSALCVMATGLGKTIYFAHLAKYFLETGRIMVIAHREELIFQAKNKLRLICKDASHEIEMGDMWASRGLYKADMVISTIQTQCAGRDGGRMTSFDPNEFSLLVIDEAHHAPAETYKRVIKYYRQNPALKVLGVTATPDRADEKAMGQIFNEVAYAYDIADGIKDGWLVPIEQQSVFVKGLDYSAIRTTAGDLNGKDLAEVMEYEQNLHAIAHPTVELTGNKKTLMFAASVAQAERLTEIINRHKPGQANFVCGTTPKEVRRDMFKDYAAGKFQYLVNVGVATEGFDEPGIECVVLARPTKSRSLYAQMVGRGTRPLPGIVEDLDDGITRRETIRLSEKPSLVIIDFVGNSGRHKLVTSADILGGEYDDDVVELAKETAAKKSDESKKPVDVASELQAAEREIARRFSMAEEAASRDRLKLRAFYSTATVNPFDVLDVDPNRERAWHKGRKATSKQLAYLKKCGVNADGLSFTHASQIIDVVIKRREKGKCTYKQAKQLQKSGFPPDLNFQQAGVVMNELVKNHWMPLNAKQKAQVMTRVQEVA